MKITAEMVRELGACTDGYRVFRNKFPISQFPDGIEINEENCGKHYRWLNAFWARDNLLNRAGQDKFFELFRSLPPGDRTHGIGDAREARVIGHIFDTMPEYRNPAVEASVNAAARRADEDALNIVYQLKRELADAHIEIKNLTDDIPLLEARIVEAEVNAVDAQKRVNERRITEVKRELESVAANEARQIKAFEKRRAELIAQQEALVAELADTQATT